MTAINGIKSGDLIRRIFQFMPEDGYPNNVNYIRLSTNFPYFHRNVFGLYKTYIVNYTDSAGLDKSAFLPYYATSRRFRQERKLKKKKTLKRKLLTMKKWKQSALYNMILLLR